MAEDRRRRAIPRVRTGRRAQRVHGHTPVTETRSRSQAMKALRQYDVDHRRRRQHAILPIAPKVLVILGTRERSRHGTRFIYELRGFVMESPSSRLARG
jgi:hypothetical protein